MTGLGFTPRLSHTQGWQGGMHVSGWQGYKLLCETVALPRKCAGCGQV